MRPVLMTLVFFAASASFAQTQPHTAMSGGGHGTPSIVSVGLPCPVELSAQPEGSAGSEWVISLEDTGQARNGDGSRSRDAGVHVELNAKKDRTLSRVKIAVYYTKRASGVVPVTGSLDNGAASQEQSKTFEMSARDGSARTLAGDLLVGPDASATRIDLVSITYSDGSVDRVAKGTCGARVNYFIRVGSR